jgi:Tfp pilus assembly protein PilF
MSLRPLMALALAAGLGACSLQPLRDLLPSAGSSALQKALHAYDGGEYGEAEIGLQEAMGLGLSDPERVDARKHLAFIYCASGREKQCREEFRKALAIAPQLDLSDAESGHPVWGPVFASLKATPAPFHSALKQYDTGAYPESLKNFQAAIREGLDDKERASAHKHLAFIHCASNRERQCRDEFRRALAADPALELDAAEAGHPVWGPVFRAVKDSR